MMAGPVVLTREAVQGVSRLGRRFVVSIWPWSAHGLLNHLFARAGRAAAKPRIETSWL